jgi:hypothetical protein
VRDALVNHRTLAWLDNEIWGEDSWVRAIWNGALRQVAPVTVHRGDELALAIENVTAIDFDLEVLSAPAWLSDRRIHVPRSAITALKGRMPEHSAAGEQKVRLELLVRNLHTRPDESLRAQLPITIEVER